MERLPLPIKGVSDAPAYIDTPGAFVPLNGLRNVLPNSPTKDRQQLGTRPGLRRSFSGRIGAGPVVGLRAINRPSISGGFNLGNSSDMTGDSKLSASLQGQVWRLDSVPSMAWQYYADVTGDGGPANNVVNAVAFSRDGTKIIFATNYLKSGYTKALIVCVDAETGVDLWDHEIEVASTHRFVNTIRCGTSYVFVATNQYVRVLELGTGALVEENDLGGWSTEVVDTGIAFIETVNGFGQQVTTETLFVVFTGSTALTTPTNTLNGGTMPDGTVTATPCIVDIPEAARDFRSGVMKFSIDNSSPHPPTVLSRATYGTQIATSAPNAEQGMARHGYWRFSEHGRNAPYGCTPTAMAVQEDGTVLVIRCNQGWGPTSAFRPSPQLNGGKPFISALKIDPTGALLWESDEAGSVTNDGFGEGYYSPVPHYNDIKKPTFVACAMDDDGYAIVAGRVNQGGWNVAILDADGFRIAEAVTAAGVGTIREGCAAIDPDDGNFIVGGDRTAGWKVAFDDVSTVGTNAHLWKINARSGRVVWGYDLLKSVSALSVACAAGGAVFGTDYVS